MHRKQCRELITFGLSIIAVVISGVSLYLTLDKDSASVRLVEFDATEINGEKAIAKLAFINSGSLPYLISEVTMVISMFDTKGVTYADSLSEVPAHAAFVLEANKMKLVEQVINPSDLVDLKQENVPVFFGAKIASVDVEGTVRHSLVWYASSCVTSGSFTGGGIAREVFSLKQTSGNLLNKRGLNPCNTP